MTVPPTPDAGRGGSACAIAVWIIARTAMDTMQSDARGVVQ